MENNELKLSEQEIVRRSKLEKYKELGLDPFGQAFDQKNHSQDIKDFANKIINEFKENNKDLSEDEYKQKLHEYIEEKNINVQVAGRIMFIRKMGKASFFTIQDKEGKIQIYIRKDVVGEETNLSVGVAPSYIDVGGTSRGGQEGGHPVVLLLDGAALETFYLGDDDFSLIFAAVGRRRGLFSMEEGLQGLAVGGGQAVVPADGQGDVGPGGGVDGQFRPAAGPGVAREGNDEIPVIAFSRFRGAPLALGDDGHAVLDAGGGGGVVDGETAAAFRNGLSAGRVGDEEVVPGRCRRGNQEGTGSASAEQPGLRLGDRAEHDKRQKE